MTGGRLRPTITNEPTDSIPIRLKGEPSTVDVSPYKPFISRLHSGEAFGNGGLVAAVMGPGPPRRRCPARHLLHDYFTMRRRNPLGFRRKA